MRGSGGALALLVTAFAPSSLLWAQSTHLLVLESATPATTTDALSSVSKLGWAGLWTNPSSDPRATGLGAGIERNSFGALRTLTAQAAFSLGIRWTVALGQTSVADLFDQELLEQDPTLAELDATAATIALDGAIPIGSNAGLGAGLRLERDDLLGESTAGWIARIGGAAELPLALRAGLAAERVISGDIGRTANGRVRMGVSREFSGRYALASLGAGAEAGGLWAATKDYAAASASLSLLLANTLTLGAGITRERDLYSNSAWVSRATVWVGINVSPVSLQLRAGSQPGEGGTVFAAGASFTPRRRA